MPYVIACTDKADSEDLRAKLRDEHLAYLRERVSMILAGGALTDDDGTGGCGGVIIIDTDDRATAEAFAANDPFTTGGLFDDVKVTRWRKAIFDGKSLV